EQDNYATERRFTAEEIQTMRLLGRANDVAADNNLNEVLVTSFRIGANDSPERLANGHQSAVSVGENEVARGETIAKIKDTREAIHTAYANGREPTPEEQEELARHFDDSYKENKEAAKQAVSEAAVSADALSATRVVTENADKM